MAHTKAAGVTKGNRDSVAKRLGVKVFAGETVQPGSIIVRQRGTKFRAGAGTKKGGDDTIYAMTAGEVDFGRVRGKQFVSVAASEK